MNHIPRILVCDDNDDILAFLYVLLRKAGFEVTTVHGLTETMDALKSFQPDLFILDVFMPECDGFFLAEELQMRGHDKPIIYITAYDNPAVRLNAPVVGAIEYLIKPLDIDVVLEKVHKALGVTPEANNWSLRVTKSSALAPKVE